MCSLSFSFFFFLFLSIFLEKKMVELENMNLGEKKVMIFCEKKSKVYLLCCLLCSIVALIYSLSLVYSCIEDISLSTPMHLMYH
jgi:hypothetical protein